MVTATSSLRERSKAKRRDAIQRAALQLFAERGYDGATVVEIAEAAEVAPRTVSMYFPTKLDLALSVAGDMAQRMTATFREHPQLAFTEVVDRWLTGELHDADDEIPRLMLAMYEANPGLRAVSTTQVSEASELGGPALFAEMGVSAEDPIAAIAGAAVGVAISEYYAQSLKSGATAAGHRAFMRYLRAIIAAAAAS